MNKNILIKIIITALCVICFGCTIIALEVYSDVFKRYDGKGPFDEWVKDYPREEISFYSGKNKLQGFIYNRAVNKGLVIIAPGIYAYADEYDRMIRFLIDNDWSVFSYNVTGVAGSEGESMRGLTQGVIDLDAALNYIKKSNLFIDMPVMLLGYSWGGYSVCAVLNFHHKINAVVSLAGFNNIQEVMEHQAVAEVGGVYKLMTPQIWAMERQLFGSLAKLTAVDGINKSNIPVMIALCSDDDVIPVNSISIYSNRKNITNSKVEYVYLEGEKAFGHYFRNYPKDELYEQVNSFFEKSRQ